MLRHCWWLTFTSAWQEMLLQPREIKPRLHLARHFGTLLLSEFGTTRAQGSTTLQSSGRVVHARNQIHHGVQKNSTTTLDANT
eukprot:5149374-Amphidinium_carterae.1